MDRYLHVHVFIDLLFQNSSLICMEMINAMNILQLSSQYFCNQHWKENNFVLLTYIFVHLLFAPLLELRVPVHEFVLDMSLILNLITGILFFMVHVRYVKHVQWNALFENFYGLSKTRIIVCYRGYPWQLQRFGLFWEGSVEDGAPANSSFLPFSGGLCRQRGVWNRGK